RRRTGDVVLTGRRFRVELTGEQKEFAQRIGDACRAVWNTGLEQRREYRRRGAWMNYREQAHQLADAKTDPSWLGEGPGHCLQQTLMDLDEACRTRGTFRVRWRSSRRWAPSFLSRLAVIPDPGADPVEVAAVLMDGMDLVVLGALVVATSFARSTYG